MNISKTLTAAVAATTIVGAVGLAYAQTTTPTNSQTPNQTANGTMTPTVTPGTAQQPSMTPTQAPSDSNSTVTPSNPMNSDPARTTSDMALEPLPKADRN